MTYYIVTPNVTYIQLQATRQNEEILTSDEVLSPTFPVTNSTDRATFTTDTCSLLRTFIDPSYHNTISVGCKNV